MEKWNPDRIDNCLRKRGVKWSLNPPRASHAGGIWEQMIRSIRRILRALLGCQLVDDETLLTLMAEVEKILNDRPLTPPTSDSNDPEPLSPSKLLLLRPNVCYPTGESDAILIYGSKRWTSSGNVGRENICRHFKSYRNGSAHDPTYLLETLSLLLAKILLVVAGQRELCKKYFRIAMETFDKLRLERRLPFYRVMFASYAFWKAL